MKRKEKVLSISAGLIILSSVAIAPGEKVIYELKTQPEQRVEIIEAQRLNSEMFQNLIAKSGVILTKDALSIILGPTISMKGIDAVTAPSMRPFP